MNVGPPTPTPTAYVSLAIDPADPAANPILAHTDPTFAFLRCAQLPPSGETPNFRYTGGAQQQLFMLLMRAPVPTCPPTPMPTPACPAPAQAVCALGRQLGAGGGRPGVCRRC